MVYKIGAITSLLIGIVLFLGSLITTDAPQNSLSGGIAFILGLIGFAIFSIAIEISELKPSK